MLVPVWRSFAYYGTVQEGFLATSRIGDFEADGRAAGPCVLVIFGAAGDLTMRKLAPALFNLVKANLLPKNFAVVGFAHDELGLDQFRSQLTRFLPGDDRDTAPWKWFTERLSYVRGGFTDPNAYANLKAHLEKIDHEHGTGSNYLFYLATAPKFFAPIAEQLGQAKLSVQENGYWRRVVVEKPFGNDLESARALNRQLKEVLQENQIYRPRPDHQCRNCRRRAAWRILRHRRHASRHGAKPSHAVAEPDDHGVSGFLSGRCGSQ